MDGQQAITIYVWLVTRETTQPFKSPATAEDKDAEKLVPHTMVGDARRQQAIWKVLGSFLKTLNVNSANSVICPLLRIYTRKRQALTGTKS